MTTATTDGGDEQEDELLPAQLDLVEVLIGHCGVADGNTNDAP